MPRRVGAFSQPSFSEAAREPLCALSFFFLAISEGAVVRVAPVVGAYPLITILLSYVFLGRLERVTWRTVAGAVLVVVGVALIAFGRG